MLAAVERDLLAGQPQARRPGATAPQRRRLEDVETGAELSQGLDAQMTYIVAKDGFASVEPGDAAYAELDAIAIRLAPLTETPSVFVLPESDD